MTTGTVRSRFHHVIDVAPTMLDVAGICEPAMVNGVPQTPIAGRGMASDLALD